MSKRIDLIGKRFGKLLVIKSIGSDREGKALWLTKCDCGNEHIARGKHLRQKVIVSCGCKKGERHKMRGTRFYRCWQNMRSRCLNKNNPQFYDYGGRGIKVCKRWNKFSLFHLDLFKSYINHVKLYGERDTFIDRKDNDGNYEPSNCRWVTREIQNNNKRNNIFLTINGETKSLIQWSKDTGLKRGTIQGRIKRLWNEEKLLIPILTKSRKKSIVTD